MGQLDMASYKFDTCMDGNSTKYNFDKVLNYTENLMKKNSLRAHNLQVSFL